MNGKARKHGISPFKAALIFPWLVLLPFFLVAVQAATAGEEACPAHRPVPGVADSGPIDPPSAFPADTLVFMELIEPVQTLDRLSRMPLWPHLTSMLSEASNGPLVAAPFLQALSEALTVWEARSEFRKHLEVLAGKRMVVGWTPLPDPDQQALVFALQGNGAGDRAASLAWMVNRMEEARVSRSGSPVFQDYFWVTGRSGRTLLIGREVREWLVFSAPEGSEAMIAVAAALSPAGVTPSKSLSASPDFNQAMSGLPDAPSARAYLNVPRLLEQSESWGVLSPLGFRLLKAALSWTGGMGIAREIKTDGIDTWLSGRVNRKAVEAAVPGLLDSLSPVKAPLSARFPAKALLTYEVGTPPEKVFDSLASLLEQAAPLFHRQMNRHLAAFIDVKGCDPRADLFPHLGRSLALAWLPSDQADEKWPFPRNVALVRVRDAERVHRFLDDFLHWKAAAMAPSSGGLVSAMVIEEAYKGVELIGLQVDSIITLPLPSPAFALVGDLLIASPVRSAVKETVSALKGDIPSVTETALLNSATVQADPLELVHINPGAWEETFMRSWDPGFTLMATLFLDRDFASALEGDGKWLKGTAAALYRLIDTLDRTTGSTVMDHDGSFTFYIEARTR